MTWVLVIYMGIIWGMPGSIHKSYYENKEECYEALDRLVVKNADDEIVALCRRVTNLGEQG